MENKYSINIVFQILCLCDQIEKYNNRVLDLLANIIYPTTSILTIAISNRLNTINQTNLKNKKVQSSSKEPPIQPREIIFFFSYFFWFDVGS